MIQLQEEGLYDYQNDNSYDSLTGVISRKVIIEIANKLIANKTPFTFMILDLDNFKHINDSFGHLVGDSVLSSATASLMELIDNTAYVGRFGGDEFIIIVPNLTDYDEIYNYITNIYGKGKIFRKYYNVGPQDIYLTATLGCATFPNDSDNYEDLFNKADKALYRGKTKGRNCYIIYVESKHGNIVVQNKDYITFVEKLKSVRRVFEIYHTVEEVQKALVDFLYSEFHCTSVYLLLPNQKFYSNSSDKLRTSSLNVEPHLEILLNSDSIFYDTPLTKYKDADPMLNNYVEEKGIQSLIISKVKYGDYHYGYILILENSISRVWQEREVALVMYASSLLELALKNYKQ